MCLKHESETLKRGKSSPELRLHVGGIGVVGGGFAALFWRWLSWNVMFFHGPSTKIQHFASLAAKWPERVVFIPNYGLATLRTFDFFCHQKIQRVS